ncbi:MAG: hypothetical protein IKD68_13140 [Solobacterium sp.]|nr:hypothetical protein [Solobacterium sp.]
MGLSCCIMKGMDAKDARMESASRYIASLVRYAEKVRSKEVQEKLNVIQRSLRELRDTQVLFDSGEKKLIRLYEKYLPYFFEILDQYAVLEQSGNYDAIVRNRAQLLAMTERLDQAINSIRIILPQDEIDEANARARAEQILEEQKSNMVK